MPNFEEDQSTVELIQRCLNGDRKSQRMLYKQYYGYGMVTCIRYAHNKEEAQEILNDGFIKVFKNLERFDFKKPFKYWLRRILINTAIDYLRKYKKYHDTLDLDQATQIENKEIDGFDNLSAKDLLNLVQQLAPSYRMVFNLYVIEGYSHKEIAQQMGISVGTSKSNLSYARNRLKKMIIKLGIRN